MLSCHNPNAIRNPSAIPPQLLHQRAGVYITRAALWSHYWTKTVHQPQIQTPLELSGTQEWTEIWEGMVNHCHIINPAWQLNKHTQHHQRTTSLCYAMYHNPLDILAFLNHGTIPGQSFDHRAGEYRTRRRLVRTLTRQKFSLSARSSIPCHPWRWTNTGLSLWTM